MGSFHTFTNRGSTFPPKRSFDLYSLGSVELMELFHETTSYIQGVRIEVVAKREKSSESGRTPGHNYWSCPSRSPLSRFVDSLDKGQRIEAIAHELSPFTLGISGRIGGGRPEDSSSWKPRGRLQILYEYERGLGLPSWTDCQYGPSSGPSGLSQGRIWNRGSLHIHLLHHNFCVVANDNARDKESQYAMGLIAFEYEKLIGKS